jgi:hypothetical protein
LINFKKYFRLIIVLCAEFNPFLAHDSVVRWFESGLLMTVLCGVYTRLADDSVVRWFESGLLMTVLCGALNPFG